MTIFLLGCDEENRAVSTGSDGVRTFQVPCNQKLISAGPEYTEGFSYTFRPMRNGEEPETYTSMWYLGTARVVESRCPVPPPPVVRSDCSSCQGHTF